MYYLKGALGLDILFSKNEHTHIEYFADIDWTVSKIDKRSTTSYYVFVGGNLILWRSKKQTVVFRFSAESEYRVMMQFTCEVLWMQHLLVKVGFKLISLAKLWCDNQTTLHIASNSVYNEKTKYIEIDSLYL